MQSAAVAQGVYPTRPVRIIVPTSAGSAADTLARTLASPLAERLGQSVVVDIRAGGATVIGTEAVAKAAADGHTLLIGLPALAINPSLHRKLPVRRAPGFCADHARHQSAQPPRRASVAAREIGEGARRVGEGAPR